MNQAPSFDNPKLSIAELDPKLIRQILLTDPSEFQKLHIANAPRSTPSFEEFQRDNIDCTTSVEATVKRAFRDHLVAHSDVTSLKELVLELHGKLRSLVPNRQDLHTLVSDDAVAKVEEVHDFLPLLLHASKRLELLESLARAETTVQWRQQEVAKVENKPATEFVVNSALYLIYKAELCQADKQDFYLQNVWAPRIHVEGPQYLRDMIDAQAGSEGYPLTTNWINELIANRDGDMQQQELNDSEKTRREVICKGWVRTILFSKDQATSLPEVLAFDVDNIRLIRRGCARAVAGCALALHAGAPASVLSERIDPTSPIGLRRADLVQTMATNNLSASSFEEKVSQAVLALAETLASSSPDISSLRSRTIAVLRGEDPVIQLLDRRMQEVFVNVLVGDISYAPAVMRSGIQHDSRTTNDEIFKKKSEEAFCSKGLSFYAPELAALSLFTKKSIDLMWQVHRDLIEKIMKQAISDS